MRIVFDFHGKDPFVGGGGELYANSIVKPPEWPGFRVELVICDTDQAQDGKPFSEGDAIHLEGNGDTLREALTQALSVVDHAEQYAREQFARRVARTEQCAQCGCWIERLDSGMLLPHYAALTEGSPPCPTGR